MFPPPLFFAVTVFLFAALFGSFLNVCIYRIPLEKSVISPGSCCGSCNRPIPWFDNIPIISWFLLRGRCRECGGRYSFRYPLIEFLTPLLVLLLYLRFALTVSFVIYSLLVMSLIVITFIDLDHQIIPDEISIPGIIFGFLSSFFLPQPGWFSSLLGILVGWGSLALVFYSYLWLTGREGMGGGDAKLLAMLGAFLGWSAVPFIILVSSLLGSLIGLTLMTVKGKDRYLAIPFGPYLALGGLLYIFYGQRMISWYLTFGRYG